VGHILRLEDKRIYKKVIYGKFHNTRPVGKPRKRLEDIIQMDTSKILEIQEWRS
jgi:hypothetical protein